ncbi:MAG: AmmeMemoRadiSam system radical SAM enzyme [Candidatus Thermoplasmatota archaeon]
MKEASFYKIGDKEIKCLLCPHGCKIGEGKRGICGVRENRKGKLYSLIYGLATSINPDPIEKKPLYHFYPGSYVFSLGTVGCNFKCLHCQNYEISQAEINDVYTRTIAPENLPKMAKETGCAGIAWTYNEPTIWYEYSYEGAKIAKENDLYTVYVTNGFIMPEPLKEISKYLDAMNIDVKAFTEDFYRKISKGKLENVLETCKYAKELGIYIELTYLIIPTLNDNDEELRKFCKWVVDELGKEVPTHFSRFHPDNKLRNLPPTPMQTLEKAYNIAIETGIEYVYIGNVPHGNYENTYCPKCKALLIERYGFTARKIGLKNGNCKKCGNKIVLVE